MKRLYLGNKGNPGTNLGKRTRAHEADAQAAMLEFELAEAAGGWLQLQAMPRHKVLQMALWLSGKRSAEQERAEEAERSARRSTVNEWDDE